MDVCNLIFVFSSYDLITQDEPWQPVLVPQQQQNTSDSLI